MEDKNNNEYIKLKNNIIIKKEVLEKAIIEFNNKELKWYKDAFTAVMYQCYGCSSCQYSKHKTGSLWQCTLHPNPNKLCNGKNYTINKEFFEREFKDELKNIRGVILQMKIGERLSINKVRRGYIIKKGKCIYVVVKTNICKDEKCSSITVFPVIDQIELPLLSKLLNTDDLYDEIINACIVLDYNDFVYDSYTYIDHLVIKRRR